MDGLNLGGDSGFDPSRAARELYNSLEVLTIFAEAAIDKLNLTDTNDIIGDAKRALAKARGEQVTA